MKQGTFRMVSFMPRPYGNWEQNLALHEWYVASKVLEGWLVDQ